MVVMRHRDAAEIRIRCASDLPGPLAERFIECAR
jgi:hypothetical protein